MPPIQRKRGIPARLYKVTEQIDNRGNRIQAATEDYLDITIWVYPQRSARGEVPGQLAINITRIGIPAVIKDVELWSRVAFLDKEWDFVTPPSYHHGNRHTRHWSIDVRERP